MSWVTGAFDALEAEVLKREKEKRQRLLDMIEAEERKERAGDRATNRRIQQETLDQMAATRREQALRIAQQRATQIAETIGPDAPLDEETAKILRDGGLGALVGPSLKGAKISMKPTVGLGESTEDNPIGLAAPSDDAVTVSTPTSFRGTHKQVEEKRKRERLLDIIQNKDRYNPAIVAQAEWMLQFDGNAPASVLNPPKEDKPTVGSFEDFVLRSYGPKPTPAQIVAARKEYAEAGRDADGGQGRSPYFTYQTVFDAQGMPIGAMKFDARGGPPEFVDVARLSGGGQTKAPPGTLGAKSIENDVAMQQLHRMRTLYDAGAKALIGPAEGRVRSLGQKIPGVEVDKTFADFEAASSAFKNAVIKAITGAQMSEPEAKRIMQQIPSVNDKPEVWLSKYAQTLANLNDLGTRLKQGGSVGNSSPAPTAETPEQRLERLRRIAAGGK